MKSAHGFTLFLLFLLLSAFVFNHNEATSMAQVNGSSDMVPILEEKMMWLNESKRNLRSFQMCAVCTCCGGARGVCLPSPCCYAINCNIPNRPFGFCSFTPKTCNCIGCHL
ncbi:uncharacterized protein LOC120116913 [Hibiscus syriacus]|uniref:uncharacterized protein LOC120116913 n=1 Tax=Hibiscus syriacus TaxID=106335 RepID=UPI0019223474|nr:uncharacterized protein LOC120116913 [Hibiscus syriacus]